MDKTTTGAKRSKIDEPVEQSKKRRQEIDKKTADVRSRRETKQRKILGARANEQRERLFAEQQAKRSDRTASSSSSTFSDGDDDDEKKPKKSRNAKATKRHSRRPKREVDECAEMVAARKARKTEQRRILRAQETVRFTAEEVAARKARKNEQRKLLRAKQQARETEAEAVARKARETEQRRRLRAKQAAEEGAEKCAARRKRDVISRQQYRVARHLAKCLPDNDAFMENDVTVHNCGRMDQECSYCHSLYFKDEKPADGAYKYCCRKGTVLIDHNEPNQQKRPFPQYLREIFQNVNHPYYRKFHDNIRTYNSVLAFASIGAKIDDLIDPDPIGGSGVFRVHGQLYHRMPHRRTLDRRQYDELYFVDFSMADPEYRNFPTVQLLDADLLQHLYTLIREHNVYAADFRMLGEVESDEAEQQRVTGGPPVVNISFHRNRHKDDNGGPRQHHYLPAVDEIAMIFQSADGECPLDRDYRVYQRTVTKKQPIKITNISPHLDPMYYVLFYPNGEPGWQPKLQKNLDNNVPGSAAIKQPRTQITLLQWKVAQMAVRLDRFNPILHGGKLFQQWAIDAQLQVETNNNSYLQLFHNDNNRPGPIAGGGLVDGTTVAAGKSNRNLREKYHDVIAIVAKFGKPDLYIRIKCNPNWPEITENLFAGQKLNDRPDLIVRVFSIKLKTLFEDITKCGLFGRVQAYVYTVKFERQELPQAHMFLILEHKLDTAEKIDRYICAEIPDQQNEPQLFETVFRTMIHGPCGDINPNAPCMLSSTNECTKKYPKKFSQKTNTDINGNTVYRRLEGVPVRFGHRLADNRYVIPYNKSLTRRYNCYINVESCESDNVLKLMFRNICSGNDYASMELRSVVETSTADECRRVINSRYISGIEAVWRLLEKPTHVHSHSAYRLDIHLPNEQTNHCVEDESVAGGESNVVENRFTTLTGWFELNKIDESARQYRYTEIPIHYVFDRKLCIWKNRQKFRDKIVSRVLAVNPSSGEQFYLRMLLHHVRGAQSFADLKTIAGIVEPTFKAAARRLNLLEDDAEWIRCLTEAAAAAASSECHPSQLRQMYALICAFNSPDHPVQLFDMTKAALTADYQLQQFDVSLAERKALHDIDIVLRMHHMNCTDLGLAEPAIAGYCGLNQIGFNAAIEAARAKRLVATLNAAQKAVFDEVAPSVGFSSPLEQRFYFVDGPAGSGKTYLFQTLMCFVRGQKRKVQAFSSTDIAASLLEGGRTVQSAFNVPIQCDESSVSYMMVPSAESERLREASLLIVDEASMLSTHTLRIIDQLLRTIMNDQRPFGGKLFILTGDFRQSANIVCGGNVTDIRELCIKRSALWPLAKHRSLHTNMRSAGQMEFNEWVLRLGEGRLSIDICDPDLVELPAEMVEPQNIVRATFGTEIRATTAEECALIASKIILTPRHADLIQLNNDVLSLVVGDEQTYASIDTIVSDDPNDEIDFQPEFLHEQCPSGLPPHLLRLKVGAMILLLRNLNESEGLVIGTRLIVRSLYRNFIKAEVVTAGCSRGNEICLCRLVLETSDNSLPFRMRRRQFPVMLAFAMTIDRAQGQSFDRVGVYLPEPVFGHGQLYSALTRGRQQSHIKVFVKDSFYQGKLHKNEETFTRNIVIEQLLK